MKLRDFEWWRSGERTVLPIAGGAHVFFRVSERSGDKPWLTLIHGFPSSSWDWHKLWPTLCDRYRVLALDLLGYGASDKSLPIAYSTRLHADTVSALWTQLGVTDSYLIGHDLGTAVSQELLARRLEGTLRVDLKGVLLMNGAVFIDHYTPRPIQRLLINPLTGWLISRAMNERRFTRSLTQSFAPDRVPSPEEQHVMWRAISEQAGHHQLYRLLHYIPERVAERERWEGALINADVSLQFVWGLRDPFVGHIAADITRRLPRVACLQLAACGHFPQLEEPSAITEALQRGLHSR